MASLNSRRAAAPKAAQSVFDLIVKRSQRKVKAVPMLTEDIMPAGKYHSEVIAVADAKSDAGKLMADVTYRFTNSSGKAVEARVRYPATGYHIEKLYDALIDAGLPEDSPLTDAVSIKEEVEIVYPFEGALGKIKNRRPALAAKCLSTKNPKRTAVSEEVQSDPDEDEQDDLEFDEDDDLDFEDDD